MWRDGASSKDHWRFVVEKGRMAQEDECAECIPADSPQTNYPSSSTNPPISLPTSWTVQKFYVAGSILQRRRLFMSTELKLLVAVTCTTTANNDNNNNYCYSYYCC